MPLQAVAARLVWEIAEAGMARSGTRFLCDDEANHPGARGTTILHCSNADRQLWKGKHAGHMRWPDAGLRAICAGVDANGASAL